MAKKRNEAQTNFFETPPTPEERQAAAIKTFEPPPLPPIDADACPKCGGHSQATAHPVEHDGHTRYCVVCSLGNGGEAYYFTP